MKINIVKMSLVAAMLLTSSAYASQITGADAKADPISGTQFGFGGLNMDNINVNLSTGEDFNLSTGVYTLMSADDTFESSVFNQGDDKLDESTRLGYIYQKPWPLSEPMGLKVINDDDTNNGKPVNCIMGSSYLADDHLDLGATPVICSSDAGSNKRFSLALLPTSIEGAALGGYGNPVDLVFNIGAVGGDHRYQVFQKVSNHTGMRLDGLKIEVLNPDGSDNPGLRFSLGYDEEREPVDNNLTGGDLFPEYEIAFYPPGLWGGEYGVKKHLDPGWFDLRAAGYEVSGHKQNILETGNRLSGNYVQLFGNWQPEKWMAQGMHEVRSALEEPVLLAYWGNHPDRPTEAPTWYYGMDHNESDGVDTNYTTPSAEEFAKWAAEPEKYVIDYIEDLPNLSLNYIVEVNASVTGPFIIRFTPKVSADQTPPSYFEDNDTRIVAVVEGDGTVTPPTLDPSSGGGGGCTYNPNSKNFDMTFLLMMALGLLYPFRRRFIK